MTLAQKIAAAIAAFLVGWLADLLGAPISEAEREGIVRWLTEGITLFGGLFIFSVYGAVKQVIKRRKGIGPTL